MDRLNDADIDAEGAATLEELFPTRGAIPEALQIGRADAIAELTEWLVQGDDVLTIQPRRIGKSSAIGYGALIRLQEEYGGVVAQADLRLAGIQKAAGLADALVNSALQTGAGTPLLQEKAGRIARKTQRFMKSARVRAASELTQESATLRTVQAVAQLLAGEPPAGIEALHQVLGALEHEAASHQRPVVVFIDEVQDLGDPDRWTVEDGLAVQQELERAMRQPGRLVTYAYAGSEETAMEHLFAAGKPLYREGERYVLPPIAPEAWREGLTGRFAHDGRAITPDGIARVLEASGGHPLRTMQVCRAALRTVRAQALDTVTEAVIEEAIARARAHPSWEQAS